MKCDLMRAVLGMVILGVVWAPPARAHGDERAVSVTTLDGSDVKHGKFDSKCAVYLAADSGRRRRSRGKELRRGEYYFQVTDPSGKQLLSTDPIENRRFEISDGVISSYPGSHPTGMDRDQWKKKAMTIGLAGANCPSDFLSSPSRKGVYKVWITPVDEYRDNAARCRRNCFHGFRASDSKTAIFRVKEVEEPEPSPAGDCLTIRKDLAPSPGTQFAPTEGWEMTVTDPPGTEYVLTTDASGEVEVCDLVEGLYVVREETRPNIGVVGLFVDGLDLLPDTVYSFTWTASRGAVSVVFQNQGF